ARAHGDVPGHAPRHAAAARRVRVPRPRVGPRPGDGTRRPALSGGRDRAPTPAIAALVAAGIEHTVHAYRHDPAHPSYGTEAADALGVDPARVVKTLVATAGDQLVVGVVPVAGSLDLKA